VVTARRVSNSNTNQALHRVNTDPLAAPTTLKVSKAMGSSSLLTTDNNRRTANTELHTTLNTVSNSTNSSHHLLLTSNMDSSMEVDTEDSQVTINSKAAMDFHSTEDLRMEDRLMSSRVSIKHTDSTSSSRVAMAVSSNRGVMVVNIKLHRPIRAGDELA
jgi:hypothetical protein